MKVEQFRSVEWDHGKAWGSVAHLPAGRTGLSLLELTKIACCSRHYHKKRNNRFHVLDAQIVVHLYKDEKDETPISSRFLHNQGTMDIPPGVVHRFDVVQFGRVVEVYWCDDGSEVDMFDIVRLEEGKSLK